MTHSPPAWRHCNMCKASIGFEAEHFICSVSTCNRKRTGLIFCSLACFEAHLPMARHRDAWAERQRSPSVAAARATEQEEAGGSEDAGEPEPSRLPAAPPQRRLVGALGAAKAAPAAPEQAESEAAEAEVLIVVSKLKKYVRDRSGMNTSDGVVAVLSDHVRELCREAIRQAGQDGRRTVLDRDFTKVLEQRTDANGEGNFRSRR
jgi:histone H3/H4